MTNLTKQDVPFEWTLQCQASFEMLKDALITSPILKYPDPNKPYTLFTDASKYAWACVLTQEHEQEKDGKVFNADLTWYADDLMWCMWTQCSAYGPNMAQVI